MKNKEGPDLRRGRNRLYDRLYLSSEHLLKVMSVRRDDLKLIATGKFAHLASVVFQFLSELLGWILSSDESRIIYWPATVLRFILVLLILVFILLPVLALVLLAGTVSSIVGLRNFGEYSIKEQFAAWFALLILVLAAPLFCTPYWLYMISMILAYSVGVAGLDLLIGQCGILSLGQGGFFLTGGYFVAWLTNGMLGFEVPIYLGLIIGALLNGAIGILLGLPALRVKDTYLLIVSMAFTLSIPMILQSKALIALSGRRTSGLFIEEIKPPKIISWMTPTTWSYFLVVFFAFALLFFVYNIIYRSQVGRAFKAIKCDREVALILGVPAVRYKLLAFVLSSIYAGFSSGMLLILNKVITWESYGLNTSMDLLTADLIGGTGGVFGSVIGGAFISLQPTLTNFLAAHIHNGQNLTSAIFGVSLIVFVIFFPLGISGELLKKFKSRQVVRRGRFQGVPPPDYDVLEPRKQYFQPK